MVIALERATAAFARGEWALVVDLEPGHEGIFSTTNTVQDFVHELEGFRGHRIALGEEPDSRSPDLEVAFDATVPGADAVVRRGIY